MTRLFQTFNFWVRIALGDENDPLCEAAFSECTGLEAVSGVKTIREGGNNNQPIHLVGPVSYGKLGLKRGMTESFDLWTWFDRIHHDEEHHKRATCDVEVMSADGAETAYTIKLTGCLPVKIKAPDLMAKDGGIAIEEMEIAYETLRLEPGGGGGA